MVFLLEVADLGLGPLEVTLDLVEAGPMVETLVTPGHLGHLDPLEVTLDPAVIGTMETPGHLEDHLDHLDHLAVVGPGIMVAPLPEDHHPDSLL